MTQPIIKNYRPRVGLCLINADKKVFVGERIDTPGAWQMPQGGIDPDEELLNAAYRELAEETGISSYDVSVLEIAAEQIYYDLPEDLLKTLWNGKYHGQVQNWVAFKFNGDDKIIDLEAHNPPEFSQWQWVDLHKTKDLIVPFKRATYEKVIGLFEHLVC